MAGAFDREPGMYGGGFTGVNAAQRQQAGLSQGGGMSGLLPYMGTAGTGVMPGLPMDYGMGQQPDPYATWQTQQADAAAHGTTPQGGFGDSATWGNYLRQASAPGGLTGAYNPLGVSQGGAGGMTPDQTLEQQRQLAFAELERQRMQYETPQAQALQAAIMGQLSGQNSPWGAWEQGALADSADAGAGQFNQARDMYNQQAANAGVKVGGRMVDVARGIAGQGRKARRDITSTRATQEDARRERAQGAAAGFLRDKAQATWAPTQAGVGLRSRFEVTGQGPFSSGGGGAQQANSGIPQGGMNAFGGVGGGGLMMANGQPQGSQGSYGGVSIIPGMNAAPWQSGGSTQQGGGQMGLNLSGYSSYPAGTTDRQYSDFTSPGLTPNYAKNLPRPPQPSGGLYGY